MVSVELFLVNSATLESSISEQLLQLLLFEVDGLFNLSSEISSPGELGKVKFSTIFSFCFDENLNFCYYWHLNSLQFHLEYLLIQR